MVNIILDGLPDTFNIGNAPAKIDTDFRLWLRLEEAITEGENITEIVSRIFYGKRPDAESDEISDAVLFFYRGGEEKQIPSHDKAGTQERLFDLSNDFALLYAAFWEQYGISLATDNLHWWAFKALFAGLSENCKLSRIMGYRGMEITSDMTAKQQEFYRSMKKKYAIALSEKEQSEIDAIENALLNGGDLTGVI